MPTAAALVLLAVVGQVALTLAVYVALFRARRAAVLSGEATLDTFVVPRDEPRAVARVSRNVANQYELPVLFYALALALLATGQATLLDAVLAWAFVASRLAHAWVHVTRDDLKARGAAFAVGYVAVAVLAVRVALVALAGM